MQLSLTRISLNHAAPTVTKSGCSFHFFFHMGKHLAVWQRVAWYVTWNKQMLHSPQMTMGQTLDYFPLSCERACHRGRPDRWEKSACLELDLPLQKVQKHQAWNEKDCHFFNLTCLLMCLLLCARSYHLTPPFLRGLEPVVRTRCGISQRIMLVCKASGAWAKGNHYRFLCQPIPVRNKDIGKRSSWNNATSGAAYFTSFWHL